MTRDEIQSCEVQFGQRAALRGIVVMQCGQSSVAGVTGSSLLNRFMARTRRKIIKAIKMKSMIGCTNASHVTTAMPAVTAHSLKLTPPGTRSTSGIRTSLTSAVIIFPKAPPMMAAIARSSHCQVWQSLGILLTSLHPKSWNPAFSLRKESVSTL